MTFWAWYFLTAAVLGWGFCWRANRHWGRVLGDWEETLQALEDVSGAYVRDTEKLWDLSAYWADRAREAEEETRA